VKEERFWRDGDTVLAGLTGIGGAGGVQRHVDERQRDREADPGEDTGEHRHACVLLSGPLYLPREAHRRPHRPLYGRRDRRKLVPSPLSVSFAFLNQ
jgi:hypothetical protein